MNKLNHNKQYMEQLDKCAQISIDWEQLRGKTVLLTGASGMIGSYMIDLMMYRNREYQNNMHVIAMSRNEKEAYNRFAAYWDLPDFHYICQDINEDITLQDRTDYVIHAASNTHPKQYALDPINTILTNVNGTKNILDYAVCQKTKRVVFLSSVEIYGENKGDTDLFTEEYSGYIDCNTLRAGYPESKRAGEALCQAYKSMYGLEVVIPRLSRVYGPTMKLSDSKAIAQFIKKAVSSEDIVLKSEGNQLYSYSYVADAVMAILYCTLYGENGKAYNVTSDNSNITLRELAEYLAGKAHKKVRYELPDQNESAGYSRATKALMDNKRLKSLGWTSQYNIKQGLDITVELLKGKYGNA